MTRASVDALDSEGAGRFMSACCVPANLARPTVKRWRRQERRGRRMFPEYTEITEAGR